MQWTRSEDAELEKEEGSDVYCTPDCSTVIKSLPNSVYHNIAQHRFSVS